MEVIKITKKVYKVSHALEKPFMNFGEFRKFKESINRPVQKCCFNCGRKFKDEDSAYLVWFVSSYNRFFCKDCNDKALADLKKGGKQ